MRKRAWKFKKMASFCGTSKKLAFSRKTSTNLRVILIPQTEEIKAPKYFQILWNATFVRKT